MLEKSLLNFSGSVNPLTVQTMQLVAGDESLQFRFVNNKTNPVRVPHSVAFSKVNKKLTAAPGILQHMSLGIKTLSNSHKPSEYRFWDMAAYTSPALDGSKACYLYAKCSKTGTTGTFLLSETAIAMEAVSGYYHFLVGILNSESADGDRSSAPLYGYSEILPGRITTDLIASNDNNLIIDLINRRITAQDGAEIVGKVKFLSTGGAIKDVEQGINEAVDAVQIGGINLIRKGTVGSYAPYNTLPVIDDNGTLTTTKAGTGVTIAISKWAPAPRGILTISGFLKINGVPVPESRWVYKMATTYEGVALRFHVDDETGRFEITHNWASGQSWIIHTNFSGLAVGDVITIEKFQLEEGNKATTYSKSPEDVQAEIAAAKQEALTAAGNAQTSANNANTAVSTLNTYVDGAFKDGLIDSSEAKAIEKYINVVNSEKAGLEATYNKLYVNAYLEGSAKTALLNAKVTYFGAVDNLISAINAAIADGKTTVAEKQNVDAKYSSYKTALASLQSAIEEANKAIQAKLDSLSTDKVDNLQIGGINLIRKGTVGSYAPYNTLPVIDDNGTLTTTKAGTGVTIAISKWAPAPRGILTISGFLKINGVPVPESRWVYKMATTYEGVALRFHVDDETGRFEITHNWASGQSWIIHTNFSGLAVGDVITIEKFQLEEGNKATTYSKSPEDVQAEIAAAKQEALTAAGNAQTSANNANTAVSTLNTYVDGAFKDGLIDSSEAKAIEKYINVVNSEKAGLEATYNKLYVNAYLEGSAKTALLNAKVTYFGAVDNLISAINAAIADGKTTVAEKQNVDAKYSSYKTALASLQSAIEEANKAIQTKIDEIAKNKSAINSLVEDLCDWYLNQQSFTDGILKLYPGKGYPEPYSHIPVERTRRLKTRFWARRTQDANGIFYFGLRNFTEKNNPHPSNAGYGNYTNTRYLTADWVLYEDVFDLSRVPAGIKYLKPAFLDNYGGSLGYYEIRDFRIWDATNEIELENKVNTAKAITDKFGTTVNGGLINSVMMVLRDLNSAYETAGISGIQGVLKNNPAFWAGGSYEKAFALIQFLAKMSAGTTPGADEYASLAKITLLHNGGAKLGDFIIEENNRIVMVDPATGQPRLVFGTLAIPDIERLMNGNIDQNSVNNIAVESSVAEYTLPRTITANSDGTRITFVATSFRFFADHGISFSSSKASIELYHNGNYYASIVDIILSGDNALNDTTHDIQKTFNSCPAGTYSIKIKLDLRYATEGRAWLSSSTLSCYFAPSGIRHFQFGTNGMMAFYSNEHFHFTENRGLDVRGKTNMPGVLAAGSVVSNGGQANVWGAKSNPIGATPITGGFRVPLNNMGHNQYVVQITPHTNTTFRVGTKTSTYFEVYGTGGFDYVVIGKNYA